MSTPTSAPTNERNILIRVAVAEIGFQFGWQWNLNAQVATPFPHVGLQVVSMPQRPDVRLAHLYGNLRFVLASNINRAGGKLQTETSNRRQQGTKRHDFFSRDLPLLLCVNSCSDSRSGSIFCPATLSLRTIPNCIRTISHDNYQRNYSTDQITSRWPTIVSRALASREMIDKVSVLGHDDQFSVTKSLIDSPSVVAIGVRKVEGMKSRQIRLEANCPASEGGLRKTEDETH